MSISGGPNMITDGLVLYLDAADDSSYVSGSNTWVDISGNNNSASLINGPTYTSTGKGGISFDGTNDYAEIASNTSLNPTGSITLCSFFNVVSYGQNYAPIIFKQNTKSSNFEQYVMGVSGNTLYAVMSSGSQFVASTPYIYGTLAFGAAVISATGGYMKLYKDGVLASNVSVNINFDISNEPVHIGGHGKDYAGYNYGTVYTAQIYNRALSSNEILSIYTRYKDRYRADAPVNLSGIPIINLDASDTNSYSGTGTTWADTSGNGYNFTLVNSPVWELHYGVRCFAFGGANDYAIREGTISSNIAATCTIQFVISSINNSGFGSCSRLMSAKNQSADNNDYSTYFAIASCDPTKYGLWYKNNPSGLYPTSNIQSGVDAYKVLVFSWTYGAKAKVYVNGVLENSADLNTLFTYTEINRMVLGMNGNLSMENSTVRIAAFSMYDVQLTDSQVLNNFNAIKSKYSII